MGRRRIESWGTIEWVLFILWLICLGYYLKALGILPTQAIGIRNIIALFSYTTGDLLIIIGSTALLILSYKYKSRWLMRAAFLLILIGVVKVQPIVAMSGKEVALLVDGKPLNSSSVPCNGNLSVALFERGKVFLSYTIFLNGKKVMEYAPIGVWFDEKGEYKKIYSINLDIPTKINPISLIAEISFYEQAIIKKYSYRLVVNITRQGDSCNVVSSTTAYGPSLWDQLVAFYYKDTASTVLTVIISIITSVSSSIYVVKRRGIRE